MELVTFSSGIPVGKRERDVRDGRGEGGGGR